MALCHDKQIDNGGAPVLKKLYLYYRSALFLAIIKVPIGIVVGVLDTIFGDVLLVLSEVRIKYTYYLIPFLGLIGVIIVWTNQRFGGISQKGMSLIFEVGHGRGKDIPMRLIPLTVMGTWLTHLFGGSAGREGVSIQIGGTLAHAIGKNLSIENSSKILLIAGMAAGFSGLFGTPIGATFFVLEVFTVGAIEHEAILPALNASFFSDLTASSLGLERFSYALQDQIVLSGQFIVKLFAIGLLFGVTGGLFSASLHITRDVFCRRFNSPILRVFAIGLGISTLSLICWGGRYSGLGTNLIAESFGGEPFPWDFALKFFFTVITIAAGFKGGEVTPLFAIGSTLGVLLAYFMGCLSPLLQL